MKIDLINNSTISKQLKLTRKDSVKVANLFRQYRLGKTKGIFNQLTDIFTPYLKEEAKIKTTQNKFLEKDFLQELYLKLFENFSKIGEKDHPVTSLVQKLSNINPSKNELVTMPKHITFDELTDTDHKKHSAEILFTSETPKALARKIVETSPVSEREIKIIGLRLDDESFSDIGKKFYLAPSSVNAIYNKSILAIKLTHNKKFRNVYFETNPRARNWLEEKFNNTRIGWSAARELFEEPKITNTEEQVTKEIKKEKIKRSRKDNSIKIENTYPKKKITVNSDKSWEMGDISDFDVLVKKDAIFKQSGIVNGNIENQGLYILTGVTKGNITNFGKLNLRGMAIKGKIKNEGKIELSGIVNNDISNDGKINITGTVKGNIINYGDLSISGIVRGNIYTYKDIKIIDDGEVLGKIVKLDNL